MGPAVDGWVIPDQPAVLFEAGRFNAVPLIAGTNRDEGSVFRGQLKVDDVAGFQRWVRARFPRFADDILATYPVAAHDQVDDAINHILTDANYASPARSVVRAVSRRNTQAYLYQFTRVRPAVRNRTTHGLEIIYVFDNLHIAAGIEEQDKHLAKAMSNYWVHFAATGNPNGKGLVTWPAYNASTDRHLEFGETINAKAGLNKPGSDLFERIARERQRITAARP